MENDKERNEQSLKHVEKLIDMVGYQEGSVVSRTLVEKKTGTVTLFAFARGQGLSEHSAPFDAMVFDIDGEVEIMISGEKYYVNKGEMINMPANKPHALKAITNFKMLLVMVRD